MSHISWVQTPVNAAGKKSRTVFFLPKFSLSFTSTSPVGFLDFKVKSGALEPTDIAIFAWIVLSSGLKRSLERGAQSSERRRAVNRVCDRVCERGRRAAGRGRVQYSVFIIQKLKMNTEH
jgi:hypothetical protein